MVSFEARAEAEANESLNGLGDAAIHSWDYDRLGIGRHSLPDLISDVVLTQR